MVLLWHAFTLLFLLDDLLLNVVEIVKIVRGRVLLVVLGKMEVIILIIFRFKFVALVVGLD